MLSESDLFRQASLVHDGQLTIDFTPVADRHRPALRCFERCQIQRFQQGLIAWKYTALAVQLPVGGVQALNRIRSVDDLPYVRGELEDRSYGIP